VLPRTALVGHGIVGILGNHEFAEEVPALEHLAGKMLVNETLALHSGPDATWLVGLDDPHYYGCDDRPGAQRGVPRRCF
jgi:hypothetical protein